ncbi:MAG: c-type cytochrome [Ilumatobacteraceae bacterium]
MTEIPEHLLKRSQQARGAAADAPGAAVTPVASTAAASSSSTTAPAEPAGKVARTEVAPVGPPPPKPDSPVVAAYKARKKIPVWAMMTLSILPVWAFMYVRALEPPTVEATGPLGEGATVYNQCASCHGGGGEGGVGYSFLDGAVITTFPHIEDHLNWVKFGSEAYVAAGVEIYGDPNRAGGARIAGATGVMPAAGEALGLTDVEILAVVCHERYELSGAAHEGLEYEKWCSEKSEIFLALEAGTATFANVHEQFEGVLQIGEAPRAGTSANG